MASERSEWTAGVLTASSWHGLEEVGVMPDAQAMIAAGERTNAYPVAVELGGLVSRDSAGNLHKVPGKAVMATYANGSVRGLAAVGDRYRATTPMEWRDLIRAATEAGAEPTGAFALREGSRVLATFAVGAANGIRTYLNLADSFDGSLALAGGTTSIRTVCANTLRSSMRQDGREWAKIRHTANAKEKIQTLRGAIGKAIAEGESVKHTYEQAQAKTLDSLSVLGLLDKLFPAAPKDADAQTQVKANNRRMEMIQAMGRPENAEGNTLATVWNGATWLVDRNADGTKREGRGGADTLDSLLFGARGQRIAEIQSLVEVVLRDGTIETMPISSYVAHKAPEGGVDDFTSLLGRPVRTDA